MASHQTTHKNHREPLIKSGMRAAAPSVSQYPEELPAEHDPSAGGEHQYSEQRKRGSSPTKARRRWNGATDDRAIVRPERCQRVKQSGVSVSAHAGGTYQRSVRATVCRAIQNKTKIR